MSRLDLLALLLFACAPPPELVAPTLFADTLGPALDMERVRANVCWEVDVDLDEMVQAGELRVGLPNDPTSWFVYRGDVQGFEHDLLLAYAEALDLQLRVVRIPSVADRHLALLRGDVDLIGGRLADLALDGVAYGQPLSVDQGAVIRSVAGQSTPGDDPIPTSIANHGWNEQVTPLRLLSDELPAERIGRQVARGELTAGVIRVDLAERQNRRENLELVIEPIDAEVGYHLATRANAPELLGSLQRWLDDNPGRVVELYDRYFLQDRSEPERDLPETLSPYDDLFRREAARIGWDPHLLMAQAFQESRFKPRARSWAGARGLMQLMPRTARELGVTDVYDPEQSVRGAVDYLAWLDAFWRTRIPDPELREAVVLASYNAGLGHVGDAIRLAEAEGQIIDTWRDLAPWVERLSSPRWYREPAVRYGYCRGREPVHYVARIQRLANAYRALDPVLKAP